MALRHLIRDLCSGWVRSEASSVTLLQVQLGLGEREVSWVESGDFVGVNLEISLS